MFLEHNICKGIINLDKKKNFNEKKNQIDLFNYICFKTNNEKTPNNIFFNEKYKFNNQRFKCITWFTYDYNNYLKFYVLKARDVTNNKTNYFMFRKYQYLIYTENDIVSNKYLNELYRLSKKDSLIYDIKSYKYENGNKIYVQHYYKYFSYENYFNDQTNIYDKINNVEKSNFIILATNFYQDPDLSTCENSFQEYRFFFILNNINPSSTYEINLKVKKTKISDNVFYIEDDYVKEFFSHPVMLNSDVRRYCLSFDLESEVVKSRMIDSELNILTHCGIEYFISDWYDYKKFINLPKNIIENNCFNICLVNIDFYFKNIIIDYEKLIVERLGIKFLNSDNLYNYFKNTTNYDKCIFKDILHMNNIYYVPPEENNVRKIIQEIIEKNITFIFMKEKNMIEFLVNMFSDLEVDYILTYNGNGYDFPQLGRRYSYLSHETISTSLQIKSLFDKIEKIEYFDISNKATAFNVKNMYMNAPYYSIDILNNYVKKYMNNQNSFSLKEVAKNQYDIQVVYKLVDESKYEIIMLSDNENSKLFKFLSVLLTANYCYINNLSYSIVDKKSIINENDNIYNIDINEIISDTETIIDGGKSITFLKRSFFIVPLGEKDNKLNNSPFFRFKDIKDYKVSIHLSKDDVEISALDIYKRQSTYQIGSYCIHDTNLCRYLFFDLLIKENMESFASSYILPSSKALCYRNSSNIKGVLLEVSLEKKSFFIKSNKLHIDAYSGGKVLEPKENFIKEPIMLFDFEALYPSIMMNYNISPDCLELVINTKCIIDYEIIKSDIEAKFSKENFSIIYIEKKDNYTILLYTKSRIGLLNYIQMKYKKLRNFYKCEMKRYEEEGNVFQSLNCNLMQLTIKISMNSIYGLLGSEFSIISCKYTSEAITTQGVKGLTFLENFINYSIIENGEFKIMNNINYNTITETAINPRTSFPLPYNDTPLQLVTIYGDTDSIMVIPKGINNHSFVIGKKGQEYKNAITLLCSYLGCEINKILNEKIFKKVLNNNNSEKLLNLEFEAILINTVILAKKKYKCLKISPYEGLVDYNIKIEKDFNYKMQYKGISLVRRDCSKFHKEAILSFYEKIDNMIEERRFDDKTITHEDIAKNSWNHIISLIEKIINNYERKNININDYIISSSFTDNYKLESNHVLSLVNNYNLTSREKIIKGDRFNYIFVIDDDEDKIYSELEKINTLSPENTFYKKLKIINWREIGLDIKINDYKIILNDDKPKNKRIFFEIYIRKIYTDMKTIYDKDGSMEKEYKKKLNMLFNSIKYS